MRISDWSSDVCSSDLAGIGRGLPQLLAGVGCVRDEATVCRALKHESTSGCQCAAVPDRHIVLRPHRLLLDRIPGDQLRSEEHTSELQSLMRISYAVFCLKKKTNKHRQLKSENTVDYNST